MGSSGSDDAPSPPRADSEIATSSSSASSPPTAFSTKAPWEEGPWPESVLPLWAADVFSRAAAAWDGTDVSDPSASALEAAMGGLRIWFPKAPLSARHAVLGDLAAGSARDLTGRSRAPVLGPRTTPAVWAALNPLRAPTEGPPPVPLSYPSVATIGGKFRITLAAHDEGRFARAMAIASSDPFSTYSRFPLRADSLQAAQAALIPSAEGVSVSLPAQARAGAAMGAQLTRVVTPSPASAAAVKRRAAAAAAASQDMMRVGGPDSRVQRPTALSLFGAAAPSALVKSDKALMQEMEKHYAALAGIDETLALFPERTLREFAALQLAASRDPSVPFDPHGARSVLDFRAQYPGEWPENTVPTSVVFGIIAELCAPHRHAIARIALERRNAIRRAAGFPGNESTLPDGYDPVGEVLLPASEVAELKTRFNKQASERSTAKVITSLANTLRASAKDKGRSSGSGSSNGRGSNPPVRQQHQPGKDGKSRGDGSGRGGGGGNTPGGSDRNPTKDKNGGGGGKPTGKHNSGGSGGGRKDALAGTSGGDGSDEPSS